jgi:excisionase family DNA binding protein
MTEHTVKEAAAVLGTSEGAIRARVRRGTLRAVRRAGRVYIVLDGTEPYSTHEYTALTSDTERLVRTLEEQLALEREAHAEARRLLAAALERIPALESASEPVPGSETPPQAETPAEPRPWWRRVFGG